MGRKWTPEQRKAASERAKKAIADQQTKTPETVDLPIADPTDPGMQAPDYGDIMKRIDEMQANQEMWKNIAMEALTRGNTAAPTGPQAGQAGLTGTYEKYVIDPTHYPDPRKRLQSEPRLSRFAFSENYELEWEIGVSSYKTLDGVNTREPKFSIELIRIVMDEDTGEPTNRRYTICKAVFHEDPDAALVVARDNGVKVEEFEEAAFLNEMRYLRIRDWLLEAFYPPKPVQAKKNKRDAVIDGKLVEMWEINSEKNESIPFDQLKTKL